MVVNQGRDRGGELRRLFGLKKTDKLVYIYIGRYGQSDLDWSRLRRFAAQGVHFLGYQPEPHGKPDNFHLVPSADWPGGDLIASSDAIVAKAGYGTVCEAMARGTPMIYPPRSGFAEFRSLDRALRAWGGGVPISSRDFFTLKLDRALARALEIRPGPRAVSRRRGETDRQPPGDACAGRHAVRKRASAAAVVRNRVERLAVAWHLAPTRSVDHNELSSIRLASKPAPLHRDQSP